VSVDLAHVLAEVAELNRRLSNIVRHGTIEEVWEGRVRVRMDEPQGAGGQPFLSPWLAQGDTHSGNVVEEQPFKKGQNVTLLCPGGDPNQATLWPFSPNQDNPRADFASDDHHTYQFGDLRLQRNGDHYHIQQGDDRHVHIHKDKGITARIGDKRLAVHDKGVKMRVGANHWAIVHQDAPHLRISEPWVVFPDDIPNDDSVIEKGRDNPRPQSQQT